MKKTTLFFLFYTFSGYCEWGLTPPEKHVFKETRRTTVQQFLRIRPNNSNAQFSATPSSFIDAISEAKSRIVIVDGYETYYKNQALLEKTFDRIIEFSLSLDPEEKVIFVLPPNLKEGVGEISKKLFEMKKTNPRILIAQLLPSWIFFNETFRLEPGIDHVILQPETKIMPMDERVQLAFLGLRSHMTTVTYAMIEGGVEALRRYAQLYFDSFYQNTPTNQLDLLCFPGQHPLSDRENVRAVTDLRDYLSEIKITVWAYAPFNLRYEYFNVGRIPEVSFLEAADRVYQYLQTGEAEELHRSEALATKVPFFIADAAHRATHLARWRYHIEKGSDPSLPEPIGLSILSVQAKETTRFNFKINEVRQRGILP